MVGRATRPGRRAVAEFDRAIRAAEFDRAIRAAGSAGTRMLTVDLTGVTQPASAGVSAPHRLSALHHSNQTDLRTGTPAETIMSLVAHDPDHPGDRNGNGDDDGT